MEIFNKGDRSGYEEIVSYGPKWWTEYREMDAVYRYEGWCLDLMYHLMDRVVKNQFPSQADEAAITIFEKLLKIEYDEEMSLEERKRVVSVYYSGAGHLNRSTILALVKAYTGHDGEVSWQGDTLTVTFNNDDGLYVSLGLLQKVLERRIPAHIPFETRCTCTVTLGLLTGTAAWQKRFTATGTVPITSRGLSITDVEIDVNAAAEGVKTTYPVAGISGEAGAYPVTSTGLGIAENSVLPEISTESWPVSYTVCGDALGI